jgi:hypothetical protein
VHPSLPPQPAAPGREHARARPEDEAEPAPLAGPSPPRSQLPRTPSLRRPHLLCAVLCATHHGARQFTPRLRGRARALRGSDVRAGRASGTIASVLLCETHRLRAHANTQASTCTTQALHKRHTSAAQARTAHARRNELPSAFVRR